MNAPKTHSNGVVEAYSLQVGIFGRRMVPNHCLCQLQDAFEVVSGQPTDVPRRFKYLCERSKTPSKVVVEAYSLHVGFEKGVWCHSIVLASSKMYLARFQALSSRVKIAYRRFDTVGIRV